MIRNTYTGTKAHIKIVDTVLSFWFTFLESRWLSTTIFISDNFLDVNSAQNSKKSERIARASFVDYVSEVVTRPPGAGLHSSNSTLTSVAREASVRSDLAPGNGAMGRPARPVSVTATGSKYKYSGNMEQ